MRILLDTHSFLWFIEGSHKLSGKAREIIADFENELLLSVGSLWEITIKTSLGKLELSEPLEELTKNQLKEDEINVLPIELKHLWALKKLPFHHRDPFDRLIVAQGISENLPIISKDSAFSDYDVEIIW